MILNFDTLVKLNYTIQIHATKHAYGQFSPYVKTMPAHWLWRRSRACAS